MGLSALPDTGATMPGPLPDPKRRRRNAPTIPSTSLPVKGRTGTLPPPPSWVELGRDGMDWWDWAWRTPQAVGWGDSVGMESTVARRAGLEDDLAALVKVEGLDFLDVLEESANAAKAAVARVASLATGRLSIFKEMRELDDRLGLTPRGLAALRWQIVGEAEPVKTKPSDEVAKKRDSRRDRLTG